MKHSPKISRSLTLVTAIALATTAANAAITYVDAREGSTGNTFATGGSLADTSWMSTNATVTGDWNKRTDVTTNNQSTIFQGTPNDELQLTTTITLLPAGIYDTWVFFWDASGGNQWGISAGLTTGNLSVYSFDGAGNKTAAVAASTLTFTGPVTTSGADRIMYGVKLGQTTVSGGSAINVFVDDVGIPAPPNTDYRTWYDGVGFEAASAIPEPSAALLGALGVIALLRRRRA